MHTSTLRAFAHGLKMRRFTALMTFFAVAFSWASPLTVSVAHAMHGTLRIEKVISSPIEETGDDVSTFLFVIKDEEGNPVPGFESVQAGDHWILHGTYSVAELNGAGYEASYDNCHGLVVADEETTTCTVTNTLTNYAQITVTKQLEEGPQGPMAADEFVLYATHTESDFHYVATTGVQRAIPPGTYRIDEDDAEGYANTSITCNQQDIGIDGTFSVNAGDVVECFVVNKYFPAPATVTLQKQVVNDDEVTPGTAVAADFSLFIDETAAVSGDKLSVDAGVHTVSETQLAGYELTDLSCVQHLTEEDAAVEWVDGVEGLVNLAEDGDYTCTFVNNDIDGYTPPNDDEDDEDEEEEEEPQGPKTSGGGGGSTPTGMLIVVTKVINDSGTGSSNPSNFLMTVSSAGPVSAFGGADTPGVSQNLLLGAFSVSSPVASGYVRTEAGDCSGTMTNGATLTCTVTYDDVPAQGGPTGGTNGGGGGGSTPTPVDPGTSEDTAGNAPTPMVLGATSTDEAPSELPRTGGSHFPLLLTALALAVTAMVTSSNRK